MLILGDPLMFFDGFLNCRVIAPEEQAHDLIVAAKTDTMRRCHNHPHTHTYHQCVLTHMAVSLRAPIVLLALARVCVCVGSLPGILAKDSGFVAV